MRKPADEELHQFLESQEKQDFSYAAIGATANTLPPGFVRDHTRITLGVGEATFNVAQAALRDWRQFRLGWVESWPKQVPIRVGEMVAVLGWVGGLWWRNACRIVYVVDEVGPIRRFGFAYGTLPGHFEAGEERFLLEWDQSNNKVWYDILAFSRPNHFLTRLGYPLLRGYQKRFGRDSAAAMCRAVSEAPSG